MQKRKFATFISRIERYADTDIGGIKIINNIPIWEAIRNVQIEISYYVPEEKEDDL